MHNTINNSNQLCNNNSSNGYLNVNTTINSQAQLSNYASKGPRDSSYSSSKHAGEKIIYKEIPVEKVVYKDKIIEKIVEKEVAVEKIVYKDKIVEKIVEKEVPVEKIVYKEVPIEKVVTKEVTVPVEKIVYVDKIVPDQGQLANYEKSRDNERTLMKDIDWLHKELDSQKKTNETLRHQNEDLINTISQMEQLQLRIEKKRNGVRGKPIRDGY